MTAYRTRRVVNALNTSTVLGLAVAWLGRARLERGPYGLLLATGYRLPVPPNPAFTLGDVVVLRDAGLPARRPRLLLHESRHAGQYAWCLGPLMLLPYALAAGWSWLRTGDPASRNVFEVRAGLVDGGYPERPVRPLCPSRRARTPGSA